MNYAEIISVWNESSFTESLVDDNWFNTVPVVYGAMKHT